MDWLTFEIHLGEGVPVSRIALRRQPRRSIRPPLLPAGFALPAAVLPLQTRAGVLVDFSEIAARHPEARPATLVGRSGRLAAAWIPDLDESEAHALRRALVLAGGVVLRADERALDLDGPDLLHLVPLPRIVLTEADWIADNTDASLSMGALLDDMVRMVADRAFRHVRLATGYLYQRGLHRILRLLDDHQVEIRLLFSGHTDKPTAKAITQTFKETLIDEVEEAGDTTFAELCRAALISGRLAVRICADTFLHAKLFLAYEPGPRGGLQGRAVIGSSNLSEAGLASGGNLELDVRVEGEAVLSRIRDWFDARWEEADEPVPPLLQVVDQWRPEAEPRFVTPGLLEVWRAGRQGRLASPDQHLALLAGLYGDQAIDTSPVRLEAYPTDLDRGVTPSPEQLLGVENLEFRLRRSRIAFLADSVGLGKTITALGAAWYLQRVGRVQRFAVVAPRKLHRQWRADARSIGLPVEGFDCINRHLLERDRPEQALATLGSYELVVVDEAHEVLRSRANKLWLHLRTWLQAHPTAMLLLVSATPWNNSRDDIFNYLALAWADHRLLEAHFPGLALAPLSTVLPMFAGATGGGARAFRGLDQDAYDRTFGAAFVQRTRTSLASRLGTPPDFPTRRVLPESAPPSEPHEAFFAALNGTLERLHIPYREPFAALQRALAALDPAVEAPPASNLMASFVLQLFKRAESSLYALAVSLARIQARLRAFRTELTAIQLAPQPAKALRFWLEETWLGTDLLSVDDDEPENGDTLQLTASTEDPRRANLESLLARLEGDTLTRALTWLLDHEVQADQTELAELAERLNPELDRSDPKLRILLGPVAAHHQQGHKPILVGAYADTALRVFLRLIHWLPNARIGLALGGDEAWVYHPNARHLNTDLSDTEWRTTLDLAAGERRTRLLDGGRRARRVSRADLIAAFAPRVQDGSAAALHIIGGEVDILVGSEAISVGQNLQDSTALIHLDLPWNPMTLEQRIGRVDRRGGGRVEPGLPGKVVDIHYCWSLAVVENEVRLRQRLRDKIQGALRDTHFDELLLAEAAAEVQAARDDSERKRALARILGDRQRELVAQGEQIPGTDALSGSEIDGLRRLSAWRQGAPDLKPSAPVVACGQLGHAQGPLARWVVTVRLTPRGEPGQPLGAGHAHFTLPEEAEPHPLRTDLDAVVATLTSGPASATTGLERRAWTQTLLKLDATLQASRARTLAAHNERVRGALSQRLTQPASRDPGEAVKTAALNAFTKLSGVLQQDKRLRKLPHADRIKAVLKAVQPAEAWRLVLATDEATTRQWLARIFADPRGFLTADFEDAWASLFAPAAREEAQPTAQLTLPTEQTWSALDVAVVGATWVRG